MYVHQKLLEAKELAIDTAITDARLSDSIEDSRRRRSRMRNETTTMSRISSARASRSNCAGRRTGRLTPWGSFSAR